MYIEKIEIEEFGKLAARTVALGQGMNLIEGRNEAGKSTLLAFIRFQLYGFPRRTATVEGGERDRRLSWTGHRAAGGLTLVGERGRFLVQRSAVLHGGTGRETLSEQLRVTNLDTGEQLKLKVLERILCRKQSELVREGLSGLPRAGKLLAARTAEKLVDSDDACMARQVTTGS